ncbi:substrate-binding domain-containing protein [Gryllotalpicola reticulitermitis]|uniref:Phosphate-binding protein n=1 Tax=Gryllotalpicola reticulitermitis TaxID=1184153 RepID=A0ABV8Q3R5_9MICO
MKLKNVAAAGAIALVSALALSACSGSNSGSGGSGGGSTNSSSPSSAPSVDYSSLSGTITAGGSSAQANAQAAWSAAFKAQASGVTINYDKSQGSGGGVTNWLSGSYDFAGTDAALTPAQFTQAQTSCGTGGGLNIPVYLSGVGIIYKLPGDPKVNLTGQLLAQIFSGKITNWNDAKIKAVNSGVTLPSLKISVVHRSDGSGTTANFTTYLSQIDPTDWTSAPGTAWPNSVGSGQQGGSGVVNTVEAGSGTIGYADQSSVGKATMAAIQVGTSGSNFSSYSAAGATAAFEAAAQDASQGADDLTKKLDYTKITDSSAYPIPLLSYDVLCKTFKDSTQGKLTAAYLGFIGSDTGQKVGAQNAGAAPLPASIIAEITKSLADVK